MGKRMRDLKRVRGSGEMERVGELFRFLYMMSMLEKNMKELNLFTCEGCEGVVFQAGA